MNDNIMSNNTQIMTAQVLLDPDKLRALALAATPGQWQIGVAGPCNLVAFDGEDITGIATVGGERNAAFIAAANPAAVLELLDEIERLKKAQDRYREAVAAQLQYDMASVRV